MTFGIYSEDFALIGMRTVTVSASLADYPTIISGPESVQIEIVDPCLNPQSVIASTQSNPSAYSYTADSPALEFFATPF